MEAMVHGGGRMAILRRMRSVRPATYQDIEQLPEHLVGEIIDGELFVSPRPAARHALAASTLGGELSGPFQRSRGGPGGWWILFEPELHLVEDVMVPDLAGWTRERMPEVPDVPYFTLAPDWVCEVLSPSTARLDLALKLPRYARYGVRYVWIVNPVNQTVEIFSTAEGRCELVAVHGADEQVRAVPFDAIELELESLWGGPSP